MLEGFVCFVSAAIRAEGEKIGMIERLIASLRNFNIQIRENEPIAPHTTVKVGGPARMMAFPSDSGQLAQVLQATAESDVAAVVLGGGANFLADSEGYDGAIVNMKRWNHEFKIDSDGLLTVDGGADLRMSALRAAQEGWCGIDFMACVPGTIGGAVAINAGMNPAGYVSDSIVWVESMTWSGEMRRYDASEMNFGYRTSRLLYGREIVTRAAFRLTRCMEAGKTIERLLAEFDAMMADRATKFPLDLPNFGSTFRSPGPPFPPAGKMIDELGMKGLRHGNAQISPMHGNFIVNLGGATSDDILGLMQKMHDAVLERHGVRLKPEVHYLASAGKPRPNFFM